MKFKTAVAAAIACLALAVPGTALAISPTQDAYGGVAGQQEEGGNGGNNGANQTSPSQSESTAPEVVAETTPVPSVEAVATTESGSSLPFTGLEVGVIALAGLFLVGGGAVLYRFSRQNQHRLQG